MAVKKVGEAFVYAPKGVALPEGTEQIGESLYEDIRSNIDNGMVPWSRLKGPEHAQWDAIANNVAQRVLDLLLNEADENYNPHTHDEGWKSDRQNFSPERIGEIAQNAQKLAFSGKKIASRSGISLEENVDAALARGTALYGDATKMGRAYGKIISAMIELHYDIELPYPIPSWLALAINSEIKNVRFVRPGHRQDDSTDWIGYLRLAGTAKREESGETG